jgi:hypothetical protein
MPITMPTRPGFVSCKFGLQTNTQTFTSPLTNNTQRMLLGGAIWTASYSLPKMNAHDQAAWQAFLLQLDGRVNTFYAYDPDRQTPRGVGGGTPLVNGANQTGTSLTIDGCPNNVTGWLKAGDYFNVGTELKQLTQDANTNGSGQTTLNFRAALRGSPADNAPITINNCTVQMILADDQQAIWDTGVKMGFYEAKTFTAIEVF